MESIDKLMVYMGFERYWASTISIRYTAIVQKNPCIYVVIWLQNDGRYRVQIDLVDTINSITHTNAVLHLHNNEYALYKALEQYKIRR